MKIKTIVIITGTKRVTLKVANWRANRSVDKIQLDQLQDAQRKSSSRDSLSDEARAISSLELFQTNETVHKHESPHKWRGKSGQL